MKRPVTLIGGAGYIGQRLAPFLANRGWSVSVIDPCFLTDDIPNMGEGVVVQNVDVRKLLAGSWRPSSPVIYLAGFHDYPGFYELDMDGRRQWQEAAREIMVDIPLRLLDHTRVIYLSSMRALTHPNTFYGNLKRIAEQRLFPRASIIRLGTVWGALEPELYNRTITVPNNWAIRRDLPDENWEAYISPMHMVLGIIESVLDHDPPVVMNAASPTRPCKAEDLRHLVPALERRAAEELQEREPHPALLTAAYYNLPLPEDK